MTLNEDRREYAQQVPPPSGGFFKGLKSATEQLRSLAPAWSGSLPSADDKSYTGPLPVSLRKDLSDQYVDHTRFQWIVPLNRIYVSESDYVSDGFLAADDDGGLVAFRQAEGGGVQLWAAPQAAATPSVSTAENVLRLKLAIKGVQGIRGTETDLDLRCFTKGRGGWWRFWEHPIREALGADPYFVELEIHGPAHQRFGSQAKLFASPAFAGLVGSALVSLPPHLMPELPAVSKWAAEADFIEVLCPLDNLPHRVRLSARDEATTALFTHIQQQLATQASPRCDPGECEKDLAATGVFDGTSRAGAAVSPCVLQASPTGIAQLFPAQANPYTHHLCVGDALVLANHDGDCISLRPSPSARNALTRHCTELAGLVRAAQRDTNFLWSAATTDSSPRLPVFIEFRGKHVHLGDEAFFAIHGVQLDVQPTSEPGTYALVFTEGDRTKRVTATEAVAFGVWQEWDARHTAQGVAQASTADLYSQFNEAKSNNFLLVLYGDIVLLNRSLNTGMSMSDLMVRLEEQGATSFAENETLRDATIGKIMLLLAGLTPIKQKFELLATMAPYYWLGHEVKWIAAVFGKPTANKISAAERKRLVPVLRRHIRGMQGDILRSLSHVEAAARPLDAIFAREELQKHWTSWSKPFMSPFLAQSIATRVIPTAAAAAVGAGSAAAVSTALLPVLASVGAMQAVSMVSGYFAKHREEGAQVRRAAQVIFPWWQVFMKTLAVSLYESREFVAEQNAISMKRDKMLLDSCTAQAKQRIVATLNQQLQGRIVSEKRTRYGEMLEGTGVRMKDLIEDFQAAAGAGMQESVDEFVASLPVARSQKLLTEE